MKIFFVKLRYILPLNPLSLLSSLLLWDFLNFALFSRLTTTCLGLGGTAGLEPCGPFWGKFWDGVTNDPCFKLGDFVVTGLFKFSFLKGFGANNNFEWSLEWIRCLAVVLGELKDFLGLWGLELLLGLLFDPWWCVDISKTRRLTSPGLPRLKNTNKKTN